MKHIEMIIDYTTDGTDFQYCDNHGPLVRCRDCKHHKDAVTCDLEQRLGAWFDDSYCSYGEREAEQNER